MTDNGPYKKKPAHHDGFYDDIIAEQNAKYYDKYGYDRPTDMFWDDLVDRERLLYEKEHELERRRMILADRGWADRSIGSTS